MSHKKKMMISKFFPSSFLIESNLDSLEATYNVYLGLYLGDRQCYIGWLRQVC
jgi:hypothetical protein